MMGIYASGARRIVMVGKQAEEEEGERMGWDGEYI